MLHQDPLDFPPMRVLDNFLLGLPGGLFPNQKVADIKLMPEGSRLVGSGGCNAMMGTYELRDRNRLKFSAIAMTKMACPDMSIEDELGQVFSATNKYAINGKILALHKGKRAPLAKFEAQ